MKALVTIFTLCFSSVVLGKTIVHDGVGSFSRYKDKFFGLISSYETEKVRVPEMISEGEEIRIVFLEKNKGHYKHFYIEEIDHKPNKNVCYIRYFYYGGGETLSLDNCRLVNRRVQK